jgi:replication fork clamp-binding protein CrfC
VVDLTLVDLPGMTKVPVKGQPSDIEEQIRSLVQKFIQPSNALILSLTAANTDLANSDALKLAREVDPDGERTIGVVTKIDLMDEGTDALDLLQGNIYPLRLGYFGVKCRSQKQIADRMTIHEAIENERQFFASHPIYKNYRDNLGIPYLTKSLNKILIQHIRRCIPQLDKSIKEQLQIKEQELVQLQSEEVEVEGNKGVMILDLIN